MTTSSSSTDVDLRPVWPIALGATAIAALVFLLILEVKYQGNVTGFFRIGDRLGLSPLLNPQDLWINTGKQGNDGQQFLTLALDPLQRLAGTSAALDNPVYRGKRILYPFLGWLLGFGQPRLIPWTLALLNVALIGVATGLVAAWQRSLGRSPLWGLALLAIPPVWIVLSIGTADLLSMTLMLTALLAYRGERRWICAFALALGLLTRETALLAWAGIGLISWRDRRWPQLIPWLLAPIPWLGWLLYLRLGVPQPPDAALAALHFGWPLQGLISKVGQLLTLWRGPETLFDAACFGLLLSTVALTGWMTRSQRELRPVQMVWGLWVLPLLCVSMQILDRFPDYSRVFIDLYGLALLGWIGWAQSSKLWMLLAALISGGYLLGYLFQGN